MKVFEAFPRILKIDPTKEIGIEVEMEGSNLPMGVRILGWKQEADNSLRGESVEFVLTNPVKRKEKTRVLKALAEALLKADTRQAETDRCGVHVHINVQELETAQVMNFVLLYLMFENVLVHYCGEDREGNLFCLRACDADMLLHTLRSCRARDNITLIVSDNYRYSSINPVSLGKYGSIEFRSLKTPKNVMDIDEWIDILLCVYDYSLKIGEPSEIVEGLSKNGEHQYLKEVFGKLAKKLTYEGCARDIRDGVRRIQDIAYQKVSKKKYDLKYGGMPAGEVIRWGRLNGIDYMIDPVTGNLLRPMEPADREAVINNHVLRDHTWERLVADLAARGQLPGNFMPNRNVPPQPEVRARGFGDILEDIQNLNEIPQAAVNPGNPPIFRDRIQPGEWRVGAGIQPANFWGAGIAPPAPPPRPEPIARPVQREQWDAIDEQEV